MTSWFWEQRQLTVPNMDKTSGHVGTTYAPAEGQSVQRVIVDGGLFGVLVIAHAAPNAGRIPTPYQWTWSVGYRVGSSGTRQLVNRSGVTLLQSYSVNWALGGDTTNVASWSMDPQWWQFDSDVRFRGNGDNNVSLNFTWQDASAGENGLVQPSIAWGGWINLTILVSQQ